MGRSFAIPLSVLLTGCVLAGCNLLPSSPKSEQALLPRQISALGRIEPLTGVSKVSVPSSLSNDRVREILIREGEQVEIGQPLAILESIDPLSATVRKSEASLQVAQRKLSAQDSVIRRYRADLAKPRRKPAVPAPCLPLEPPAPTGWKPKWPKQRALAPRWIKRLPIAQPWPPN